jgi:hypothetical protein
VGAAEALGGSLQDRLGDSVGIGADVAVPEADDGPSRRLEKARAHVVAARADMLAAVYLDDQLRASAGEVGNIWADGSWRVNFGR